MHCGLNPEHMPSIIGPGIAVMFVLFIMGLIASVIAIKAIISCMIFAKAGYHWAMGLLMIVPIANIIMPFVLAFGKWPIKKELEQLRQELKKKSA
jgi:ABC-type transport system involved in cytochrome bd biosynthesis fused ATPase/permease subunit